MLVSRDTSGAGSGTGLRAPSDRVQRLTVLGATGSVGKSALDIVGRNPDRFEVVALVANSSVEDLAQAAIAVGAQVAVVAREELGPDLAAALSGSGIATGAGTQAVMEAVDRPCDMVVGAIVGAAGLKPTMASLKPGRSLALANKECLVCAGSLFMERAREVGTTLLPVDSEHSAIFQVFEQGNADQIEKIILTASGGPFRQTPLADLTSVTPEQALKHPNWDMGSRITIDSATMMNKGFEVIEAFHLFPLTVDQLDVLVHPQSIIHGMVQYRDGSLLAQLGAPDMRTPIAHCLAWPERMAVPVERLDLSKIAQLTFEAPDMERFPALRLATEALQEGPIATASLNAADEIAVAAFLQRKIGFLDIAAAVENVVERMLSRQAGATIGSLEDVLGIDAQARSLCAEWVSRR
ncbi:1-deoxy-D-xylulose-5-phosphate reductoisomerase [Roseibium limicola]|uniref:1-deoxy-D-xylulose-5-phosphate reductoisomerase n=1 Tax=Roseibium limicola TaxID=2816037 RepID=UPI001E2D2D47|nr:1-deoxy-D-xylulose-5-phosphate reductoisomerase [Roseibium limicola]